MRILALLTAFLVVACGATSSPSAPAVDAADGEPVIADAAHNSRNSLDWAGTYSGTLPCADCEGIRTRVTLHADGTFERELVYLGEDGEPVRQSGRFSWNDAGSIVTIAPGDGSTQMYQVGENKLFHLDQAGKRIGGELANRYVLGQALRDPRIENRKWLLVEVMGQPYEPADQGRQAFVFFDGEQSRASGNASCNNFFGSYVIEAGQRIRFNGNIGATRMACPDMSVEKMFLEALQKVDNYAVSDGQLSLNRARMAPLLRFERAPQGD